MLEIIEKSGGLSSFSVIPRRSDFSPQCSRKVEFNRILTPEFFGNEQFFHPADSEEGLLTVRRATFEAFSRQLPILSTFPESDIDGDALAAICLALKKWCKK
jgi:hypothetical protein